MYVLDTNIISALITKRRNSLNLSRRILVEPLENLFVSIITVEEILSGYLSAIQRSRHLPTVINRYRELEELGTSK
jgi:predicted nucleic acid-binding protein